MSKSKSEVKRFPIYLNAYEVGLLQGIIWPSTKKKKLMKVFEQLLTCRNQIWKEENVKVTDMGKKLRIEVNGIVIIRPKWPWEK